MRLADIIILKRRRRFVVETFKCDYKTQKWSATSNVREVWVVEFGSNPLSIISLSHYLTSF